MGKNESHSTDSKKPGKKQDSAPQPHSMAPVKLHCIAEGCTAKDKRFGFCDDHYDQFKFGLIKKDGQRAADYTKKLEHYLAHKERQAAQKVA